MISNVKNNLLQLPSLFSAYKVPFSIAVLVIFHLVGFWGLVFSGNAAYFQNLTPLNLLLTISLLFLNHKNFNLPFFLFAIITFLTSFFAEVIGVHTGLLFGNYQYGEGLGFKLLGVPLMIGFNWLMLVYCTGIIARKKLKAPTYSALFGAALMVMLDFLIEPVAGRYDFWIWENNYIPVYNFICWLGLAFGLQLVFQFMNIEKTNRLALPVFITQLLFFFVLNLFL